MNRPHKARRGGTNMGIGNTVNDRREGPDESKATPNSVTSPRNTGDVHKSPGNVAADKAGGSSAATSESTD